MTNFSHGVSEDRIISQFSDFIHSSQFRPKTTLNINADGKIHRYALETDRGGATSGAYSLHMDGCPAGFVMDWHDSQNKLTWKYEYSDEERREYAQQQNNPEQRKILEAQRREHERKKAEAEKLQKENQQRLLNLALAEYRYVDSDFHKHPYLTERFSDRGIFIPEYGVFSVRYNTDYTEITRFPVKFCNGTIHGGKLQRGDLVVPFVNVVTGKLQTLQRIPSKRNERGKFDKWFYGGLPAQGAAHILWPDYGENSTTVFAVEGFCTGLAVLLITGGKNPVYCTGSCSNLLNVCKALKSINAKRKIVIMADNDSSNAGEIAAQKCIRAGFADDYKIPPNVDTDFYDYVAERLGNAR